MLTDVNLPGTMETLAVHSSNRRIFVFAAVLLASFVSLLGDVVTVAYAGSYAFKLSGGSVPLAIPDGWQTSAIKNGVEVKRPDQEVIVWIQATTAESIGGLMDEYKSYFVKQGVTFPFEPKKEEHDLGPATALDMRFDAKWNGKPTVIVLSVINRKTSPTGLILLGYWASPKADKESDPAMELLVGSLIAP